jgi:hypothetical protein
MKHPLPCACLSILCLLGAAPARSQDAGYNAALTRATAEHKDLIVFVHGTPDWDPDGAPLLNATLGEAAWRADLPKDAIAMSIAVPDSAGIRLPESSRLELERLDLDLPPEPVPKDQDPNGRFHQEWVWNYPAWVYQDQDGRLVGRMEGLRAKTASPKAMAAQLAQFREARIKRDALLKQAGSAAGLERARLLGQALDALPFDAARTYREVIAQIGTADPEDRTGYTMKYTWRLSAFGGQMLELAKRKEYAKGLALIAAHKAKPIWTLEQRQALEVQRYILCREWPGHGAEARQALEAAIILGPDTDVAAGCKGLLKEMDGKKDVRKGEEPDDGREESD